MMERVDRDLKFRYTAKWVLKSRTVSSSTGHRDRHRGLGVGSKGSRVGVAAALALIGSLGLTSIATAAPPDFVLQAPSGKAASGSGAGELDNPRGVAGAQDTGRIYIADRRNARISEFTAWGRFVKAWGWGVANGAAELQTCGPAKPEATPSPGLCQEGLPGSGKGQMALLAGGIAVDGAGNVWVGDLENFRVQKFSPAGQFLLMLGGEVNKTKVEAGGASEEEENLCPFDPGDECQLGTAGGAPSYFSGTLGDVIAHSPSADAMLVGDKDRIQIFDLDGTFREEIPFAAELASFTGNTVNGLDVGAAGSIYLSLNATGDVYKLSAAGVPLTPGKPGASSFEAEDPLGVAVDVEGNVYAIDDPPPPGGSLGEQARTVKFDAAGNRLLPTKAEEDALSPFPYLPGVGAPILTALATNICPGPPSSDAPGNLYIAFFGGLSGESKINAYGTGPVGCEPPPPEPPKVVAQYAATVGREEAIVKAQINPVFFQDATYFVEYGTGKCSEEGCDQISLAAGLTSKSVNKGITTAGVILDGLEPGTTYHYRFVAQSSGGGPVSGEDPDGEKGPENADFENGVERTFKTFPVADPLLNCPANKAFRVGAAAELPDCRVYEIVSPLEKANADVALGIPRGGNFARAFEINQSASSGERFAFTSLTAFAEPKSAPFLSQYIAERGNEGWRSKSISPPRTEPPIVADQLLNGFQGLSADLCMAWLRHNSVATLVDAAIEKYPNLYRRENCTEPAGYEALSTAKPPNRPPDEYFDLLTNGFSADGTHTIFTANDSLTPDAPTLKARELLLYEHTPEGLRFVCYLPNGKPSPQACAAGTGAGQEPGGSKSSRRNAISADGSRIFWTAFSGDTGLGDASGAPGQIYARIEGAQTIKVSGSKAADPAWYWTAADDGSKVIFEFAAGPLVGQLYEFDVDSQTATLIAKGVSGPLGASEDASRLYFVSQEDLDDGGPASASARNVYLYQAGEGEGGSFNFVMALAGQDIGGSDSAPAPVDEVPYQRAASVSPDGLHMAFASVASPTPGGYENLDASSDEPVQEIYRYDALQDELACVSCNPTGARPLGEQIGAGESVLAAARIQGWEALLHAPRVISGDGNRVFFESLEALVARDTNGAWDVYQWEEAGTGSCAEGGATFSEASGGCVDLISAGKSPANSVFLDADLSGEDVFIGTQSSLVAADYGLNDVYDVRVGGGFPEPVTPQECEGETCQSPPPPPPEVTPASAATDGPGNVDVGKPNPKSCKKGMRKVRRRGKVRCVRKSKRSSQRRAAR